MSVETAIPPAGSATEYAAPPLAPFPDGWRSLGAAFVARAKALRRQVGLVDSMGTSLTYGDALMRSVALARVLGRMLGPSPYVGVLLPPTVPAAVANVALTLLGKIPVNLNYTVSEPVLNASVAQCGMSHVITARRALDKFQLRPAAELVLLDDLPRQVRLTDKIAAAAARWLPATLLARTLPGLRGDQLDETATVIFTSGSTGEPKGVVLTHRNVLSNAWQIDQQVALRPDDVILGILPFFHSFGYTVTLWTALALGKKVVYHISPLDAKVVARLCAEHKVTLLAATPTFVRGYLRSKPEKFASVRLLILGAEKLKPELDRTIRETLRIEPLEGYGCTETGPVVSVNVPGEVTLADGRTVPGNRLGTVGRPLPGTRVRTVDPATGAALPIGAEGLIQVRGPQVMTGYLDRPETTAQVLRDGWYATGDLGLVDADGFLTITGRLSRFAKIGGEMVPHHAVESAIACAADVDEHTLAVTSLPDPKRGERLVVVHTGLPVPPEAVCRALAGTDLPRLWIPSAADFVQVERLPVLGTGKLDLCGVRALAEAGVADAPRSP
jgi:acyl-[acyl-carrier-protein]-phospholipid O-acyltransferase/long-chain-fatty-acid--[acyl-carrier-protein] ligase